MKRCTLACCVCGLPRWWSRSRPGPNSRLVLPPLANRRFNAGYPGHVPYGYAA